MPGNSARRGAVRKPGSKKGAVVGSGGRRRRALEGKGPTPRAQDRPNHKAYRAKQEAERSAERAPRQRTAPGAGRPSSEYVAGRNAVVEALREGVPVTTLHISGRPDDDRIREALTLAAARAIPVMETPRGELDRLTSGGVHQGIAIKVPPFAYSQVADLLQLAERSFAGAPEPPLIVALDSITDPRNLGAIIRSVAAFGGHGVVVPERRAAGMTAAAWKTSAGAAARVPVAQTTNLTRALRQFREGGFFVVGLDMGGDIELPELELATEPLVMVVGSEGKGLSRLVRESCDQVVSIPMPGRMESLNASVACGVTLYEVARRRAAAHR